LSLRETAAVRSHDEIADAIRAFTPAQSARLRTVALIFNYAMPADDLLQEAFARALDDDGRQCPVDVDVVKFLLGVMRSIASDEYEKAKLRPAHVAVIGLGDPLGGVDPPDPTIGIDDWLAREQHAARRRQEVLALFEDDPVARDILEGRMAEMSVEELKELTGLDATGYDSKLKLIRRRIDKKFPKGWAS